MLEKPTGQSGIDNTRYTDNKIQNEEKKHTYTTRKLRRSTSLIQPQMLAKRKQSSQILLIEKRKIDMKGRRYIAICEMDLS